jgi:hypothetical protein
MGCASESGFRPRSLPYALRQGWAWSLTHPQIFPTVITPIAINVLDLFLRPFSRHVEKRELVDAISHAIDLNVAIAIVCKDVRALLMISHFLLSPF